jgi:hypothetical protein
LEEHHWSLEQVKFGVDWSISLQDLDLLVRYFLVLSSFLVIEGSLYLLGTQEG